MTKAFAKAVLDDAPHYRPVYVQPDKPRGMKPLGGGVGTIHVDKYVCPHGDYVWYERRVGVPVPPCPTPTHGALVRA